MSATRALGALRRGATTLQARPAAADAADDAARIAHDERLGRHVPGHDRARADHRVRPDRDPAQERGVRPDRRAAFQERRPDRTAIDLAARPEIVGQHRVRAQENVVLGHDSVPDRDTVLDGHSIAQHRSVLDETVLADVAPGPDARAGHHVRPGPDARSGADCFALYEREGGFVELATPDRRSPVRPPPGHRSQTGTRTWPCRSECWAACSTRVTLRPTSPLLLGTAPLAMHSRKWEHSARKGSDSFSMGVTMSP